MALLSFGSCYWSTATATVNVANTPIKAAGTTSSMQLADFSMPLSNRLTYTGADTRTFEIRFDGSVSKGVGGATQSLNYIYRNGTLVTGAITGRTISSASDIGAFSISAQVIMTTNDYIELWLEDDTGDDLTIEYGVLSAKVLG